VGEVRVTLSAERAMRTLLKAVAALTILSALAQVSKALGRKGVFGLVPMLDSEAESNLPTFASSVCLLAAALLVAGIAAWHRRQRAGTSWRPVAMLAAVLAFGSFDEATAVHEKVGGIVHRIVGELDGPLRYSWVVPGAAVAGLMAVYFVPHALRMPPAVKRRAAIAAGLFFSGALGLELAEGAVATAHGEGTPGEDALVVVEECLEMLGAALAVVAALKYYEIMRLEIRLSPTREPL